MSKSRTPSRSTKKQRAPAPAPTDDRKPSVHPWIIGGVNYGPAVAAVHDLAAWVLDLAAKDVADWPEGKRRVRNARRYVLDRLRGKHRQGVPFEDLIFAAGLIGRIFEADLQLGMSEVIAVLDKLGLPTEEIPLHPRMPSIARMPMHPPIAPVMPFRPRPVAVVAPTPTYCDECGRPQYRNAA